MPITWSGPALRSAAAIRRSPRPASATTMAAPARQHAYTATVRSMPGRHQQGHPLPGLDAVGLQPRGGRSRIRCSSSAKEHRVRLPRCSSATAAAAVAGAGG